MSATETQRSEAGPPAGPFHHSATGPAGLHRPANGRLGRTQPEQTLTIRISRGAAEGRTRLSAFDGALRAAGVADFNLIRLSSVIPAATRVIEVSGEEQLRGSHGDALYCVYAAGWASTPHSEAWAGVAWSRRVDGSGAGLFVEHEGLSESEVARDLADSLDDLAKHRDRQYEPAGQLLTSIRCRDLPVCALVIATYRAEGWSTR